MSAQAPTQRDEANDHESPRLRLRSTRREREGALEVDLAPDAGIVEPIVQVLLGPPNRRAGDRGSSARMFDGG